MPHCKRTTLAGGCYCAGYRFQFLGHTILEAGPFKRATQQLKLSRFFWENNACGSDDTSRRWVACSFQYMVGNHLAAQKVWLALPTAKSHVGYLLPCWQERHSACVQRAGVKELYPSPLKMQKWQKHHHKEETCTWKYTVCQCLYKWKPRPSCLQHGKRF